MGVYFSGKNFGTKSIIEVSEKVNSSTVYLAHNLPQVNGFCQVSSLIFAAEYYAQILRRHRFNEADIFSEYGSDFGLAGPHGWPMSVFFWSIYP